jgi:hypothetical protein
MKKWFRDFFCVPGRFFPDDLTSNAAFQLTTTGLAD